MPSRPPADCPHDQRPGTVTCLYCARDAREAARKRLLRFLVRAGVATALALILISVSSEAVVGLHERTVARESAAAAEDSGPAAAEVMIVADPNATEELPPVAQPIMPSIAPGTSELGEGIIAIRRGSGVLVQFDTPMLRTRRADKFERIVRETLPRVYRGTADSLLAGLPAGALTADGDLLEELPSRGIHLPDLASPVLSIFPETRPGRDGPLVVGYRVTPGR